MKKTNMKFTCVFDGELSAGDIFSAFLLEEFEKERTKRKSRKSDFFIDADVNFGYNGNRFMSYLGGMCG